MQTSVEQVLSLLLDGGGLITELGIELSLEDGTIVGRLPIQERHHGAPGVAHGGALMALLDTTLGAAALQHAVERGFAASTVEMKVNFLRPAPVGGTLTARAELTSIGRSLLVATGKAHGEDGEAVGFAVGTFNLFPLDKVTRRLEEEGGATP